LKGITVCVGVALLVSIPAMLAQPEQAHAGGSSNAVTIQASGSPLGNLAASPLSLSPTFGQTITDYVLRCQSGINTIQLTLTSVSGGTIAVGGRTGSSVTLQESLHENQAVIINAADPNGGAGNPVQYWIRCLPHDFPQLSVTKPGNPAPGWYLTGNTSFGSSSGTYSMVLDSNGTPVWYRQPAGKQALNVTPLSNESIAWKSTAGPPSGAFEDYNLFTQATSWLAPPVSPTDFHELEPMSNGDLMLLSNPSTPNTDVTVLGGSSSATIVDCLLQEVDPNGHLVWQWRASDHIAVSESTHPFGPQWAYDIFHCNSIDTDTVSGNILLSARHTDAVYLIDKASGTIIWKLGGNPTNKDGGQILAVTGDSEGVFHAQHDARFEAGGDVSVYDDQTWDESLAARGVEYHVDTAAGTAALVWSYQSPDGRNSAATGSFRRLYSGTDNVIGWGFKPNTLFTEVDGAGAVMLNVALASDQFAYRVVKVPSSALDHDLLRATAGLPPFSFLADTDPSVSAAGVALTTTEGLSFTSTVATFADPDPNAAASEYLATIAWSDGSSSEGTISGPPGGPFTITGTHAYAEEGTNAVTVYINDPGDSLSSPVTATSTAIVSDAALSASGTTISATEGTSFTGAVGSITDANPNATTNDYSATVAWGDGSTSPGTISGPVGGPFTISGTHTYAGAGTDAITASVTDTDSVTNGVSATSIATVAEAATSASGTTISVTEGMSFTGPVGSITDANPNATTKEFSATVAWGDGSTSPGSISGPSGGPFTVSGSHTYAEEGTDTIAVSVTDADSATNGLTAASTANGSDAALSASCAMSANVLNSFSGKTASFSDADPGGSVFDYTATISWADGSSSTGTLSGPDGGPFTVSGRHTYASTGKFNITTTVHDAGGRTVSTSCPSLVYAFPTSSSFAIGDNNSAIGAAVTFWSGQWAKLNSLSGGRAPDSFNGFWQTSAVPTCGGNGDVETKNSATPVAGPLPEYMGVIVNQSIKQSGSANSGRLVHIVIVRSNPGYQPDAGHAGTGTVVAQVC
jgi:Arylsulfotransferase (ASST)